MRKAAALSLALALLIFLAHDALAISKENAERAEELKAKAIELFNKGEYRQSIPLFNEVLSLIPDEKTATRYLLIVKRQIIEPYCKMAAEAYMSGNYPKAVSEWQKILEIDPGDKRVRELIASTFSVSDQEIIETSFKVANNLIKESRYDEATAELEKILTVDPTNDLAQEMLASIRRTLTDATIRKLYEKADIHVQQEEYDLAIQQWTKILKIDPEQELASRQLASMQKKKLDEVYTKAMDLYLAGDYVNSRDYYLKILAENPTDQSIKIMIEKLNKVINVVPQISEEGKIPELLRKGISNYISKTGKPKIAVAAVWYAVQLNPDNPATLAVKDFIERENVSVITKMENPVSDMNIIDQYLFAALNHIYEGRYDLAIQDCMLVNELDPENVLALKRMGSAYFAMGRKDKAKEAWNEALKLTPEDKELKGFIKAAQ